MKIKNKKIIFYTVLFLILIGITYFSNTNIFKNIINNNSQINKPEKNIDFNINKVLSTTELLKQKETEKNIKTEKIHNTFLELEKNYPNLELNISFRDLKNNIQTDINGQQPITAASTIKVLIASMFLEKVQNGEYSLDMKMGNYDAKWNLEQMVVQSNNLSCTRFNDLMTKEAEKNYAKDLGLFYSGESNLISTNDLAKFLEKLYSGELLNPENTKYLLSLMSKTHDDTYIPGADIKADFYHKTGKLDGFVHDAGIIDDGTNQYVLVIFSNGTLTAEKRIPIFHEIVKKIYQTAVTSS